MRSLAHSNTTPGQTGNNPCPKIMLEKVGIREKIPTGGLSLSTPHSFLHLPAVAAPISLLMQCLPILFNHFSYFNQPIFSVLSRTLFSFFPEGGAIWVPHASLLWAGSVPTDLLVVYLRGFLVTPFPLWF